MFHKIKMSLFGSRTYGVVRRNNNIFEEIIKNNYSLVENMILNNSRLCNALDMYGNTPLHVATSFNNYDLIKLLIKRSDIYAKNKNKKSCWDIAIDNKMQPIIDIYVNHMIDKINNEKYDKVIRELKQNNKKLCLENDRLFKNNKRLRDENNDLFHKNKKLKKSVNSLLNSK